jgi:transposase
MDGTQRRCIGLDVHRDFAQVAICQAGQVVQAGTFATTPEGVREFAAGLGPADEVALEATGNTWAIVTVLASRAGRVVVANPGKTRAIAEAKVKTDKVDAAILAQLLAADYLPAVWQPDAAIGALRRQVLRRAHIVRQRTRLKNQVHAILHRNLVPRCPAADLFGIKGRAWLAAQQLPPDERAAADALLRQLDFHAQELALIDADLGQVALARPEVLRLMTIPGVDATVALSIVAAAGDFTRFRSPDRLVSYLGLNPRVRQSGGPARQPRPDHQGRPGARPRHAGRSRLVRIEGPRSAARVLSAGAGPPRHADRCGGHRPQARRAVLAPDHQARGLRLRPALAGRPQAAQARAARRAARRPRPQGHRRPLFPQSGPRR